MAERRWMVSSMEWMVLMMPLQLKIVSIDGNIKIWIYTQRNHVISNILHSKQKIFYSKLNFNENYTKEPTDIRSATSVAFSLRMCMFNRFILFNWFIQEPTTLTQYYILVHRLKRSFRMIKNILEKFHNLSGVSVRFN